MSNLTKKLMQKGASVTISRTSCPDGSSQMLISVRDDLSGVVALELEMTMEAFAMALTACAFQPAEATWNVDKLGMRRETKTVLVPVNDYPETYEVDGWRARYGDYGNHHHSVRLPDDRWGYSVVFTRWVKE